jgi:hypothetical protein
LRVALHHKSVIYGDLRERRGMHRPVAGVQPEGKDVGGGRIVPIHFETHLKGRKKPYSYELKTTKRE